MNFFKDYNVRKKLFVGISLIIFFFLVYNIRYIWVGAGKLISIFSPFIMGLAIAFILNVPMRWIEKGIFRDREKYAGPKWQAARRVISLVLTLLFAAVAIALLLCLIIPQLAETIGQLVKQIPAGIKDVTEWVDENFSKDPIIMQMLQSLTDDWMEILQSITGFLRKYVNQILEGGISAVSGILSGVVNFVLGFIFSLYVLAQKEKLGNQSKKAIYALFERKKADNIMNVAKISSKTFANFISGQCVEALILCAMFCISMTILKLPYALLIGVLIGACNLIPIVGAFIGCGIGVLLILIDDPMKAIVFLVLFLVLQQIEGNLIYPKVVGNSIGLPGIWVLVSVTVGGSLFGVVGMIVFIPLVSVTYALFRTYVYKKLEEKGLVAKYRFYGWEDADVKPVTKDYPGIESPYDLYDALSKIWCEYTCAPRLRDDWTAINKTLGQCSITAFLVQDIFGGEVRGIKRPGGNYHCYNVVDGKVFDLTSEQFGDEELDYTDNPEQSREEHFSKTEKKERYEYLKAQLHKYIESEGEDYGRECIL